MSNERDDDFDPEHDDIHDFARCRRCGDLYFRENGCPCREAQRPRPTAVSPAPAPDPRYRRDSSACLVCTECQAVHRFHYPPIPCKYCGLWCQCCRCWRLGVVL